VKKAIIIATAIVFVITLVGAAFAADMMKKVDTKMLNWTANTQIAKFGHDKTIVKAVYKQDKEKMTLKQIKDKDYIWRSVLSGTIDIMNEMMNNDCAKAAKALMASHPYVTEIFVYDNQGANVCMTSKTGDYWQGDEGKFWNSYNGGIGSVFVDAVEEDGGKMISQVSVPVMKKYRAIGAMTVGVDVSKLP